jgi:hypothetical protein
MQESVIYQELREEGRQEVQMELLRELHVKNDPVMLNEAIA